MIIVDDALRRAAARGRPVRVGMIGCGFMGAAIARQIARFTPGVALVAVANRTIRKAVEALADAGMPEPAVVAGAAERDTAMAAGRPVVTDDPALVTGADGVDVVLEVTGTVAYAASVVGDAIANGKHVLLMNAELDATVGPMLKIDADTAGVLFGNCDGDQPGVQMNLVRFVSGMGLQPVLSGNIKGLHDPYRTPETQAAFAARWGQRPEMVTSFADGSKIAFEQAIVANAAGFGLAVRGMRGYEVAAGTPIERAARRFDADVASASTGIVDYVVGAAPAPGVFVLATCDDPRQRRFLELYKLGEGPLYCFHNPCHLCHFEVPNSIARMALFADVPVRCAGAPRIDVVATAKRNLARGDVLDGIGGFCTYGQCEDANAAHARRLLPLGLAEGARIIVDKPRDSILTWDDVDLPRGGAHLELRRRQDVRFFGSSPLDRERPS